MLVSPRQIFPLRSRPTPGWFTLPFPTRAFTVVELLITVAIIGLLAALLLPVGRNAVRKSMQARGMSNLRQLVAAEIQYAAENNGNYTAMYDAIDPTIWQRRLGPYLGMNKDDTAFWKEQRVSPKSVFNVPDSKPAGQRAGSETSIGMNPWTRAIAWNYRSMAVPYPARTILLGEMPQEFNGDSTWPPDWGARAYSSFNRQGRTNPLMAFCDGHVEAMNLSALYDAVANRPAGAPNLWHWFYQPGMGQANWE